MNLLNSIQDSTLLRVSNLAVEYRVGRKVLRAVSDVSFELSAGETLGLVGESGCGKSSLGRAIIQLPRPCRGQVLLDGVDLTKLRGRELRKMRPSMPMVFQDPISALNPRRTIREIIEEPLVLKGDLVSDERRERVNWLLDRVGLPQSVGSMHRRELSGGQCQRVNFARAIAVDPKLLICDEPTSSLDVSVQAQIINLLQDLQEELGFAMIFISHNLALTRKVATRIGVAYLGRICELGEASNLYSLPVHPYTNALVQAVPSPTLWGRKRLAVLSGDVPSPIDQPAGCAFSARCPRATGLCNELRPELREVSGDRKVACHFPIDVSGDDLTDKSPDGAPRALGQPGRI